MSQGSKPLLLRPAPSAYVISGCMFGPLLALSLYNYLRRGVDAWVVVMLGGILLVTWGWLAAFQLSLQAEVVSYRTLFAGKVSLDISEIEDVRTEINFRQLGPPFRLIIRPKPNTGEKPLIVNMKVFRLNEIREFIRALEVMTHSQIPFRHSVFQGTSRKLRKSDN